MSCNVLIIPEDPTNNGYILQPLVARMLGACGKSRANVKVLSEPKVSGFEHACGMIPQIIEQYGYFDLMLFLPDSDGKNRSQLFAQLEAQSRKLICCAAEQEVEAWLLAGHLEKLGASWREVRADISVKERFFAPFLREFGDRLPGQGRERLMRETLTNLPGLLARCPELADLQKRICDTLAQK